MARNAGPTLLAEYYCTDADGYTDPCPRDADIQFVIDTEVMFDVHKVWIDYRHYIIALTASDENGVCTSNVIWVTDIEQALSQEYSTVGVRRNIHVSCEFFDHNLETQLTPEFKKTIDEMHEEGRMD
jgi:hypothetical protein